MLFVLYYSIYVLFEQHIRSKDRQTLRWLTQCKELYLAVTVKDPCYIRGVNSASMAGEKSVVYTSRSRCLHVLYHLSLHGSGGSVYLIHAVTPKNGRCTGQHLANKRLLVAVIGSHCAWSFWLGFSAQERCSKQSAHCRHCCHIREII